MLYKAARRAGNDGKYPECRTKMLEAKMQEPYSIRILNDLATVAIAMQGFVEAVRPLPCLVLLNIYSNAAQIIKCPAARPWPA